MAATKADANTMQYSLDGGPWNKIIAPSSIINTNSLQYSLDGGPWFGINTLSQGLSVYLTGSWLNKPVKIYSGGSWLQKPLKYYNGSAWV